MEDGEAREHSGPQDPRTQSRGSTTGQDRRTALAHALLVEGIDCITEGGALIEDSDLGATVREHAASLSEIADRLASSPLRTPML